MLGDTKTQSVSPLSNFGVPPGTQILVRVKEGEKEEAVVRDTIFLLPMACIILSDGAEAKVLA